LQEGAVLVVGASQSGAQIAEDLQLAGRRVAPAVSGAPRCARFHRDRDVVARLHDPGLLRQWTLIWNDYEKIN
jgi:putative flavoprotein involved in K+ transport